MSAIPNPTITISCLHYEWETLEEAFTRAREEFGLDGIEFSWPHPRLEDQDLPELKQLSVGTGLPVDVHFWGNLAQLGVDAGADQMRQWLEICLSAGFGNMIVHGGSHDDQAAGIEITTEVLSAVAGEFEQADVTICLENHYAWDYHDSHELFSTPEEFLQVFHTVNSPALGFLLDYGHSQMTGNTGELLEALAPYLEYTHLADNMGTDDDHLAFGDGVIPWREVFEQTRAVGYRGPFTVEFPVREGCYHRLPECREMLEAIFGD